MASPTCMLDVSRAANSLCALLRIELDGSSRVLGSGFFFMQQDVVATARHIIEEVENAWPRFYLRIQPLGTLDLYSPVECCYHAEQDLAFLVLDRPHPKAPPLLPGSRTKAGFMYAAFDPVANRPFVDWVPRFSTPVPREHRHTTEYCFEWDCPTKPGNSGGPLIATDGGVVAILSGVASNVQSSDCQGRPVGATKHRARAVWINPLMHTFFRWKFKPDSMLTDPTPFMHR